MQGLLSLLVALVAAAICASVDNCNFKAYEIMTIEDINLCYDQITDDTEYVRDQTVAAVLSYLDANAFTEYYRDANLSVGFPYVDIKSDVAALKDADFTSEYEFHWELARLMRQLKDPHSVYSIPSCFTRVYYALPFAVSSYFGENGQYLTLNQLPTDYAFITVQYLEDGAYGDTEFLFNAASEQLKIDELYITDEDGNSLTDNESDPVRALRIWADDDVYVSKNSATRFNRAIRSDFYIRGSRYGRPSYRVSVKISGTIYELPWLAVSSETIGSQQDLLSFCPLNTSLPVSVAEANLDSGAGPRQNRYAPMQRMLSHTSDLPPTPSGQGSSQGRGAGASVSGRQDTLLSSNSGNLTRLYSGDHISLYSYVTQDRLTKAHVISVPSFSPDSEEQFVTDMQNIMSMLSESVPGDMLFVDLRDNGGGYIELGVKLLYYMLPDMAKPSSGFYMRKKCDLYDLLDECGYFEDDETLYEFISHSEHPASEMYADKHDKYSTERTFIDKSGESVTREYMANYTFCNPDYFDYSGHRRSDMGDTFYENIHYDASNTYLISEGYCGSTCATYAAHVSEIHAGKLVGLGGVLGADGLADSDTGDLSISSFAGGSVLDSQEFEELLTEYEQDFSDSRAPPFMPRNGYIRFPYEALLSWRDNFTPLEFMQQVVDFQVPWWPQPDRASTADELSDVLAAVIDFLNQQRTDNTAFTFETDEDCDSGVANAVGGHYFDVAALDFSSECSAVYCADGYYPIWSTDGYITSCEEISETQIPIGALGWVGIVSCCLAVAVMIGVFVYWLIRYLNGNPMSAPPKQAEASDANSSDLASARSS
eukprot:gnl/Chilomastix_cuspidata/207.p1 GENE.gnl/Chilomastix_cuspidata/207~~gnl/Chilomastix_cuspidata/207.p1  ORF type:complete len:843 (-),score=287.74 gnl/Chilomastix_cuspidata/207:1228-3699(-)